MAGPKVDVSPKATAPSHHVSFAAAGKLYGLQLVDGPAGITEIPQTPSSILNLPGGGKFGDHGPGHSNIQMRTGIGGRGSDDFSEDPSKFLDSKNAFTMIDGKIFPAPLWRFATGLRTTHEHFSNDKGWQALIGSERYVSHAFTVGSGNLGADSVQVWLRRKGKPQDVTIEIWTNSGGNPSAVVTNATAVISTSDVPDYISKFVTVDLSAAADLTQSTVYHIVIYGASGDSAAAHWEIAVDLSGSTSKDSTAGSSWATAAFDIIFRVTDADIDRKWHFFEVEGAFYAVDERADSGNSVVYMNGERGKATAGGNSTLTDTDDGISSGWTDDQWNGYWIKIVQGTGKGQHRLISDTTSAGLITVSKPWATNPDNTSLYVIYGGPYWQKALSSGDGLGTVLDVAVIDNLAYFAQGPDDTIRVMRWDDGAGTPIHAFRDDGSNKTDKLLTSYIPGTGPVMWRARNSSVKISRATAVDWPNDLSFGTGIKIGDISYPITNMLTYDQVLYVWKEDSLWGVQNDKAVELKIGLDFLKGPNTGEAVAVHGASPYFSWADFSLQQLVGRELLSVGPDRGTGLPDTRGGKISALGSHPAGLFAGIDGGSQNTSSVMVYGNVGFGWHEIFRAWGTGNRVQNIAWQDNRGTNPFLWISVNGDMVYQGWARKGFNPLRESGSLFQHEAVIDLSPMDFGAAELNKLFSEFNVHSQNLAAGIVVFVDYKLDENIDNVNADWQQALLAQTSPHDVVRIDKGNRKKIALRLRLVTKTAATPPVIDATVLEGFARTPVKYQWTMRVSLDDNQLTLNAAPDHDPDELLTWLKQMGEDAELVHMRTIWENIDNLFVVVEPLSVLRDSTTPILGTWGGRIMVTVREA